MAIPLTARAPVEFTPPTLAARYKAENDGGARAAAEAGTAFDPKPVPRIIVRVPTMYERDSFAAALVRGGVVHYSKKQIRDLMLAGASHLFDDDKFEQLAAELEELWQAGDAATEAQQKRVDRYIELMEQQNALPVAKRMTDDQMEKELAAIMPAIQISEAKRVRVTAVQQDITSRYAPMQMAFADLAEQNVRRSWVCVETFVINWKGLAFTPDGNGHGGITRAEAEWLREQVGADAFEELAEFIFAMHSIDGDEEKNLASLIESSSAPTGSRVLAATMSGQATGDGNSTDEPSSEIPSSASPKTTGTSSDSSTPVAKKTGRSRSTRTAAP